MAILVLGIIGFLVLFALACIIDVVQYAVMLILAVSRTVLSIYVTGFNSEFYIFAALTSAFFLFLIGTDAFDSDTDGDIIFKKVGNTIRGEEDENHPIQAFLYSILGGLMIAGIEYIIFAVAGSFVFMTVICAIESVFALISFIQAIR